MQKAKQCDVFGIESFVSTILTILTETSSNSPSPSISHSLALALALYVLITYEQHT